MREPWLASLREDAALRPLNVDVSDYSDEFCAGFLAGQVNGIDAYVAVLDLMADRAADNLDWTSR